MCAAGWPPAAATSCSAVQICTRNDSAAHNNLLSRLDTTVATIAGYVAPELDQGCCKSDCSIQAHTEVKQAHVAAIARECTAGRFLFSSEAQACVITFTRNTMCETALVHTYAGALSSHALRCTRQPCCTMPHIRYTDLYKRVWTYHMRIQGIRMSAACHHCPPTAHCTTPSRKRFSTNQLHRAIPCVNTFAMISFVSNLTAYGARNSLWQHGAKWPIW